MAEDKIAALFGNGKLSYDELLIKAGESGIEVGDVLEVKGEYNSRLHSERIKHALERGLEHSKAKNSAIVGKMIDLSLVTSDEDGVYESLTLLCHSSTESCNIRRGRSVRA